MSLGKVSIAIEAQMAGFESDMGRAARVAEKEFKKMGRDAARAESEMAAAAKRAGKVLGTAIAAGAAAAAAALVGLAKSAIDNADKFDEMSQKLGISTEQLSKWAYAAKLSGTDIEGLERSFSIFSKNVAASLNPTSAMGRLFADGLQIDVQDAEGNLRSVEELLPEIADKFKSLDDQTLETALAMKLFGRSGADMLEFLNRGSEEIAGLGGELESLGGVIDGKTAAAAAAFNDNLDKLKIAASALGMGVARELLPHLIELTGNLVAMSKDGETVNSTATTIADTFRALGQVVQFLTPLWTAFVDIVRGLAIATAGTVQALQGLASFDFSRITQGFAGMSEGRNLALLGRDIATPDQGTAAAPRADFSGVTSTASGDAVDRAQAAAMRAAAERSKRLRELAFGPTKSGGGSKAKAGPSAEERAAEALLQKYTSLAAAQRERIALFGQEGEAAKVRYDIENESLEKLDAGTRAKVQAIQTQAIADAERLDVMTQEAEVAKTLADESKRQEEAFKQTNTQILEQIELVGMSAAEQEIWNNLAWAGVNAESAKGREIIANTLRLQEAGEAMADQVRAMDSVRAAGSDFVVDLANGVKPIDAISDAFDQLHQQILRMIAENLMEQLFGKQGDPDGGSAGDWLGSIFGSLFGGKKGASSSESTSDGGGFNWGSLISSLFGGGRASGGPVSAGRFYEVGEMNRPEIFSSGGKSYLIPGNNGAVTPIRGGGGKVQQTFVLQGTPNKRTAEQYAQKSGREAQRALARTR